jgi:GPH family glycoside/pentoside/hexuronide:cation symporter
MLKTVDASGLPLAEKTTTDVATRTVVGWGVGSLAVAILYNTTNMLMLRYLVDYVGVAAALASGLIAFSKIYDTVTDPLMGVISDRTRSSIGRRRPWLLVGAFLCAFALPLLFITPQLSSSLLVVWVTFALLFYATAYTVFSVPYMAMPVEMTDDPHMRSVIFSWRVKFIAVAQVVAGGAAPVLIVYFGGGKDGHAGMSIVLGVGIFLSALLCFRYTRGARALPVVSHSDMPGFREQVRTLISDSNLVWLLSAKMIHLVAVAFSASSFAFFTLRVLQLPDTYLSVFVVASSVGIFASAGPLASLSKRLGKQNTYSLSVAVYAAATLTWLVAPVGESAVAIGLRGLIQGVAGSGMMLMAQSLLSDVMADDRARTGMSREGVYAGLYTTIEKLSYAFGIAIVGVLLGMAGYIEGNALGIDQPKSVLDVIRWSVSIIPAGLAVLAAVFMHRVRPAVAAPSRNPG